jgi:hypothetical protein
MRGILMLLGAIAVIGATSVSDASAAPASLAAIDNAPKDGLLTTAVHCRWYPHRHRNNNPHAWGRGCGPAHGRKK